MRRTLIMVISVLLIGVAIFLHRIITTDKPIVITEEQEQGYHLNDSLDNSLSDLPTTRRMEQYIERWMSRNAIKGASLAVMRNEQLIYCKGFGWADKEMERKANVGDIYRMASASKLITAVGIMKLIDEGRLTLDSKVFGPEGILSHFTEIKDKRAHNITVRQLLNHTSGFSRRMGDPMFRTADVMRWEELDTTPTADQIIAFQLGLRLRGAPGGTAQYSNVGYLVLSRVIEEVSGMDYEEYLQEHGYVAEDKPAESGKALFLLRVFVAVIVGIGAVFSLLSIIILTLSIYLLLQKNVSKLENLVLVGYKPSYVAMPYNLLTMILNISIYLISIVLVSYLQGYYMEHIGQLLGVTSEASPATSIVAGLVLTAVITLFNFFIIHRKIAEISRKRC